MPRSSFLCGLCFLLLKGFFRLSSLGVQELARVEDCVAQFSRPLGRLRRGSASGLQSRPLAVEVGDAAVLLFAIRQAAERARRRGRLLSASVGGEFDATRAAKWTASSATNGSLSIVSDCSGITEASRLGQLTAKRGRSKTVRSDRLVDPPREKIDAPLVGVGPPLELGRVDHHQPVGSCRQQHGRAPHHRIEPPADGENAVANHLGFQPLGRHPPE